jgi:hypothetical protein
LMDALVMIPGTPRMNAVPEGAAPSST